jgi:hypothetical protein
MDFARDQFLASPGVAENQHRRVGGRDEIDLADDLAQGTALTNQIAERTRFQNFLLKVCVLLFELRLETLDFFERTRIAEQYFSPNVSIEEFRTIALSREADPLTSFGEACRAELKALRAAA